MTRFARSTVVIIAASALFALSACAGSSPASTSSSASPSSAQLSELAAVAGYFHAKEAWWTALTPAEVSRLIGDSSWGSSDASPSATTYVVLMRGDFNDSSGNPIGWAVSVGRVGSLAARVMKARPEVPGHTWTALEIPFPSVSP